VKLKAQQHVIKTCVLVGQRIVASGCLHRYRATWPTLGIQGPHISRER